MKRFLKIVGWGLAVWGLSLAWPSSAILTPRVADALMVGLVVAVSAFFLGQHFTQPLREYPEGDQTNQAPAAQPTRPSGRVKRDSRTTRPIPELAGPSLGSLATQPMPVTHEGMRHSRITRPMPIAR